MNCAPGHVPNLPKVRAAQVAWCAVLDAGDEIRSAARRAIAGAQPALRQLGRNLAALGYPKVPLIDPNEDARRKDGLAGGPPRGLAMGLGWHAPLANFRWPTTPSVDPTGPRDLISYLRIAVLEFAGFQGLADEPEFLALRPRLLADVVPF